MALYQVHYLVNSPDGTEYEPWPPVLDSNRQRGEETAAHLGRYTYTEKRASNGAFYRLKGPSQGRITR